MKMLQWLAQPHKRDGASMDPSSPAADERGGRETGDGRIHPQDPKGHRCLYPSFPSLLAYDSNHQSM